jgi:multiple sugar transport system permease protein
MKPLSLRRSVNTIVLCAVSIYFAAPVWWLFVSSTKTAGALNLDAGFWFTEVSIVDNLQSLFAKDDAIFARWLGNSLIYGVLGAAIGTLLAVMTGYALSKFRFKGKEALFSVILAGVLVPPAALSLPLFLMFSQAQLTNTYISVLLPSVVSPLGVYLARVAADAAVPDELLEAAAIDGAGQLRTFVLVSSRIMGPAVVTIFLFQFVAIWNNFLLPLLMLNSKELYPVTLGLYNWSGQFIQDSSLVTAVVVGSFVSVAPLIVAFLLLQRFWQAGLAQGSVK